jgi:dipeptidyl aminopeptidase/acylaminoacyl peptidase
MRKCLYLTIILILTINKIQAQNGKIISKEHMILPENLIRKIDSLDTRLAKDLKSVNLFRIVYLSDGLKVVGFLAQPKMKSKEKYPCIIANRGGRWNFGLWNPLLVATYLGRMASWGYIVVASQYRGSIDGGEGKDEFGGQDVNDVLNLFLVLSEIPAADTTRVGMYGESRGGMMTYLALKRSCDFKAATVVGGMTDAFDVIKNHPELEDVSFKPLIPDYSLKKDAALRARSAVFWSDSLCRQTPLLIMHGGADSRVNPNQSTRLVQALINTKHPVRFIIFEKANHFISEFEQEMLLQCRRHFDHYVRDRKPLPGISTK